MDKKSGGARSELRFLHTSVVRLTAWRERMAAYSHIDSTNAGLLVCLAFLEDLHQVYYRRPLWDRVLKRGLDLAMSLLVLSLLWPVLLLIAVAIKLNSSGPVFFSQMRTGIFGIPFRTYKFRTMYVGSEHLNLFSKPMQKLDRDPRSTKVGIFLREWRLDELPQVLNIIKGEMSWVGPRPLILEESSTTVDAHLYRFAAKPGLTGMWQATRSNRIAGSEKLELDSRYALEQSLWLDIKLILLTIPRVMRNESVAHQAEQAKQSGDKNQAA